MIPEASLQLSMLLCHNEDLDARISKGKPLAWSLLCKGTREISKTDQLRLPLASHKSRGTGT
jgi:hypothetical protein